LPPRGEAKLKETTLSYSVQARLERAPRSTKQTTAGQSAAYVARRGHSPDKSISHV